MADTPGTHFARAAMRTSMYRLGPAEAHPSTEPLLEDALLNNHPAKPPEGAVALMRMVDFRIPLPWLMSGFIIAISGVIAMYYQLQSVSENLRIVQVTMSAQTELLSRISAQQALQQYRIEKLEAADRRATPGGK